MRRFALLSLMIALLTLTSFDAEAQQGVQNYVSASGYVIFNAPFCNTGADGYAFDFENDYVEESLVGWKTIDADGDTYNWTISPIGPGYGHNGSDGAVFSYSYSNYSGPLTPDNYLVSPKLTITANCRFFSFYACALDEAYPADHFGVAVSTTGMAPANFTMLQDWTMTSKSSVKTDNREANGSRQGNWHEYIVDLGNYVGQDVYVAIRHYNSADNFCLVVDDILVGPQGKDPLTNCSIALDGVTVAQNIAGTQFIHNTEGFANNSTHTTTVTATYQSGATLQKTTEWTYRASDSFQGSPTGLQTTSNGSSVNLSWTLPMMQSSYSVDDLSYDFADSTLSDLTLIDANHDGFNFRVYPFGGYGSGYCLKSDSWMTGNIGSLNPDNFIVLPRLVASENTVISFMARDADMPGIAPDPEHFGVAVSTSGNTNASDFTMVQEWNSTGTYTEYTADLSAYAGQQIYVALRHFNTTGDTYYLYVDNIEITNIEATITRPAKGALVYANGELIAMLNHGETSFIHNVNRYESEYCIRIIQQGSKADGTYFALAAPQCANAEIECVAPKNLAASYDGQKVTLSWQRDIFTDFEDDPQGWSFLDVDGDGYVFGIYDAGGMEPGGAVNTTGGNASLVSFSYNNNIGDLHPNNYAFMPLTKVLPNAMIEFYAAGFDPSYPTETFSVVVASSDGQTINSVAQFTTSHPYTKYSADLSDYAGQNVFIGFRHFSPISAYALCIDNITVINAVWAGTASVTERYNIYRSFDGSNFSLIGWADGDATSYEDHDIQNVNQYYKVTAINTVSGGLICESAYAMSADGNHDYVYAQTLGIEETTINVSVYPNPTSGIIKIESENLKNISVFNAIGQKIFESEASGDSFEYNFNGATGIYLIKIETSKGTEIKRIEVL